MISRNLNYENLSEEDKKYLKRELKEDRKWVPRIKPYEISKNGNLRNKISKRHKNNVQNLNIIGIPRSNVHNVSHTILSQTHAHIPGYVINHCFGYDDPGKFVYIPQQLHFEILKYLRMNKISSDTDHWNAIRDLINNYEGYTYIRC